METERLIEQLSGRGPVRRLPTAWRRVVLWLLLSLPYVAAVVWTRLPGALELSLFSGEPHFVLEQGAAFATALTAAMAAFCSVVPGHDRRLMLLPLVPLAIWIASVGGGCIQDWIRLGVDGLTVRADWDCLPPAMLIGIVPGIAMVVMLRRGAPLTPGLTLALGALAVAALANFGMQLFHAKDASIMVLVWHLSAVAVIAALAGSVGEYVLRWRHVRALPP